MDTKFNDLDTQIAARVRFEREARQWSLTELADRSGVSKAMISRIERGETSPTAVLLGRLSGAFGLTLSSLLARAEDASGRLLHARDRHVWQDPETGFRRQSVSPPGAPAIELVHCELPPGVIIRYPAAAFTFIDQQILMLEGTLTFTEGDTVHELGAGDCLALGMPVDSSFANRTEQPCTYLVAIARRHAR